MYTAPLNLDRKLRTVADANRVQYSLRTSLLQALLHGFICREDFLEFLQCPVLGLGEVEVHDCHLDQVPEHEHQVEAVADLLECWSGAVLQDGRRGR
jgi:hypothetical protein